jgi:hypothetical protein
MSTPANQIQGYVTSNPPQNPRASDFTNMVFQPGVASNAPGRDLAGRWQASNRVRWHKGNPEKIGGWSVVSLNNPNGQQSLINGSPVLLLHMDTSAFADSSPNNLTMTAAAGAVFDTSAPKFGAGDLSCPSSAAITCLHTPIVTGNPIDLTSVPSWTIEGWIKITAIGGFVQFFASFGVYNEGGSFTGVTLGSAGSGTFPTTGDVQFKIYGQTSGGGRYPEITGVTSGAWHHFAMVKQPSGSGCDQYQLFIDGIGSGWTPATTATGGYVGPYASWAGYAVFGSYYDTAYGFQAGNVCNDGVSFDEVRISNYTVYTANFTPPTAPFSSAGTLATSYDLQRNGASIATVTGGATAYADTMPAPGSYSYQVFAGAPGADVSAGSNIVTLGYLATIPNVVGMTQAVGTATLNAAGFSATPIYQSSSTVPAGVISAHNPGPVPFPLGANVIITVSTGAPMRGGTGGDTWGTSGGDQYPTASPEILGHTLAQGAHPANALNAAPSQSVMAAMSAGQLVYQSTSDLSVPSAPKVG